MKPAQWTAVLALALMVAGITCVSVYLGSSRDNNVEELAPDAPLALTFPIKSFPQKEEKALITEVHQPGYQDFWFLNESGHNLTVGLLDKGCTCSQVQITLAPPSWCAYGVRVTATQALQLPLHGMDLMPIRMDRLTMMAVLTTRDQLFPDLPAETESSMTLIKGSPQGFTVPAESMGRIRLSWEQPISRKLDTYATLWIGNPSGTVNTRLDAHVNIVDPVLLAAKELKFPAVTTHELEELEKQNSGQRIWIICGSMTRSHFDIKAELLHEDIKAESDPVEIGAPVPLDKADYRKLAEEHGEKMPTIISGLKIPVTLKARAKDGTPAEWGYFSRYIRMIADGGNESVAVQLDGQVLGAVSISEMGKVRGSLDLGPFPRKRGTQGSINLETDAKDLDLELDTTRLPEFLKASLKKLSETGGGHRVWQLRVVVPPDKARGEFPRPRDPLYRDSAVYVKTKGKPPHSIRIPIMGTANEG